jgi:tetratricopeptide (TPR) repeat protein
MALPSWEEREAAAAGERFRSPAFVREMIRHGHDLIVDEPERARALGRLAEELASHLPAAKSLRLSLAARAGVLLTEELLRRGLTAEAESLVEQRIEALPAGRFALGALALCRYALGLVRRAQHRYQEAQILLRRTLRPRFRHLGGLEQVGEVWGAFGFLTMDVGEYGWGLYFLQLSQRVLEAVEEVRPLPRLQVASGMAVCLVILGEPERAAEVVAEARRLYRHLDRLPRYRAEAMEGDLALLSGDLTAAERIYLRSLKRFLSAGAQHDAVRIGIRLALLYRQADRGDRLRKLTWLLKRLDGPGLHRRNHTLLAFGFQVAMVPNPGVEPALEFAIDYLERSRHNPGLPFYPAGLAVLTDWSSIEEAERRLLCRTAGVPEEAAGQAGPEIRPDHRDLLSWTLETLKGARLVFPDES